MVCPSWNPKTWLGDGSVYGMISRHNQTFAGWQTANSGWPGWRPADLADPVEQGILCDSNYIVTDYQLYQVRVDTSVNNKIHLRHNGVSNLLYADGHADAATYGKLVDEHGYPAGAITY